MAEHTTQLGHTSRRTLPRRTPGARRDWKTPRVGRFSLLPNAVCSPALPGGPEKPARLRFKSRGFGIQAWGVYKNAGRWPAGFQATPTRRIKTQTYVIFCAQADPKAHAARPRRRRCRHRVPRSQAPAASGPPCPQASAASAPPRSSVYSLSTPVPQALAASGPPYPKCPRHPTHRAQAPTALARAPAASIPLYARLSQPAAQRVIWLPGMSPSCISCIKPRHANYLQYQRYARHMPIALRASAPQARDFPLMCTSVAHDPSRICTLDTHTFHAPRSAPQASPHSQRACASSIRCRMSARQARRASRRSSGRASTKAFSRWPIPYPPRSLPHRSRR